MEQIKSGTRIAGVDVGKHRLDAAIEGVEQQLQTLNDAAGITQLCRWLAAHGVVRVGVEATAGYERELRLALEAQGMAVVVHQPIEVRLYGRLNRQHAKTDACDARLIAAATAAIRRKTAPLDPVLAELAEWLTAYEHIADQLMSLKTFRQSLRLAHLHRMVDAQMAQLRRLKAELLASLIVRIKADAALKGRYDLLTSLPGIGPVVAASLIVRMPELGSMQRGQAASLLGVAPHACESGQWKGQRFIGGGRYRPRRMLYLSALAAKRCDRSLKAFADRLTKRGKPAKLVTVAGMRKLIEAPNIVLKRQSTWTT